MSTKFKSAIEFEKIMEKPLGNISAVEFVAVLNHPKVSGVSRAMLADKKKYELWIEEGTIEKIPVGVIIEKLKFEKKKLELEPGPYFGERVFPYRVGEAEYGRLVEDIAVRVEERLKGILVTDG